MLKRTLYCLSVTDENLNLEGIYRYEDIKYSRYTLFRCP